MTTISDNDKAAMLRLAEDYALTEGLPAYFYARDVPRLIREIERLQAALEAAKTR